MSLDVPTDELGLYANLFIKKARDDVDFFQKQYNTFRLQILITYPSFDDFVDFTHEFKKHYPMKVETLELGNH